MIKAAVLGHPVAHSLSPRLHGYWLRRYGIEGSYEALDVAPAGLEQALRALADRGYAGANLTVPHKEAALAMMDEADETARRIGAVNTVIVREGGALFGANTDAHGFIAGLRAQAGDLAPYLARAAVLGAGGAARAVCAALIGAGAKEIIVMNRRRERAEALSKDFGAMVKAEAWENRVAALSGAALLVNATSLGMRGQPPLELQLGALPRGALVTDVVYRPLETPLLAAARARGNPAADGLGMLLHQAQPAFAAWFGVRPEVTEELRLHMLEEM